jgi:hypothetical protein
MGIYKGKAGSSGEDVDGRTGIFVTRGIEDLRFDVGVVGGEPNPVYGPLFAGRLCQRAHRPGAVPVVIRELSRHVRV